MARILLLFRTGGKTNIVRFQFQFYNNLDKLGAASYKNRNNKQQRYGCHYGTGCEPLLVAIDQQLNYASRHVIFAKAAFFAWQM